MITTFLIDLPVLAAFGVLFSFFTRNEDEGGCPFGSSYFWHGLVFSTLFNAVVLYSYFKFPDWMWMYFVEGIELGVLELIYIFFFLYYIPYVAGFVLGNRLAKRSLLLFWLLFIFFIGWEVWIVRFLFDRYSVIGTQSDYSGGTAVSMFSPENPIGLVGNVGVGAMIIYFLFVWWSYRKKLKASKNESEL